ncbi:MAG: sigma-54-dependent transcriptional regulator [Alphaproteobacteria bacterium]
MNRKILIVEDEASQRRMIALLVQRHLKMDAIESDSGREALSILNDKTHLNDICLVVIDFNMPGMNGLELLNIIKHKYKNLPVIMLTGSKDIEVAVQAMKSGASDFLNKPVNPKKFEVCVRNSLKINALEKEVKRLKHKDENTYMFKNLIGYDSGLHSSVNLGRKAASADIPVLLEGETGVGKEVFARAIHGESSRSGKPFVAINCGAIPDNLVESTLFGHEKGAFTGAVNQSLGRFREAEGGTIFLDEIGELPLTAQVKLLRVLQEKEVRAVGSDKPVPINVRIISATNRNLETDVSNGLFREDLYFRLNVLPITLPTLRERKDDIPLFIHHFIDQFSFTEGLPIKNITTEVQKELSQWKWSGNVRELENTIHRAMVLCDGDALRTDDFKSLSAHAPSNECNDVKDYNLNLFKSDGKMKTINQIEKDIMKFSMEYHNNNITQAARSIGMAKSTFYRKLNK